MRHFLTTTIAAAAILGSLSSAHAEEIFERQFQSAEIRNALELQAIDQAAPSLASNVTIAVARLDGGRLIPTPYGETEDWSFLDKRIDANIVQLSASRYIKYIPELPLNGVETNNKIDEVRLAAANEGFEYILMYGVGSDADWASFGGLKLQDTGLSVKPDCAAWEEAKAKALLINSFTGQVLGAATADNIEFNIGELADEVEHMIYDLTPWTQTAEIIVPAANKGA